MARRSQVPHSTHVTDARQGNLLRPKGDPRVDRAHGDQQVRAKSRGNFRDQLGPVRGATQKVPHSFHQVIQGLDAV